MKAHHATALLVHHRPKPNSTNGYQYQASSRGGTALPNSCRFHIMLAKANGGGVKLSFEKVSRGVNPDDVSMQLDEERKLWVPTELDRYVAIFQQDEQLTTTEVLVRLEKNPEDHGERHRVLDCLRRRSRPGGKLSKITNGLRGEDSVWKRVA
jgi:hypothetical protein